MKRDGSSPRMYTKAEPAVCDGTQTIAENNIKCRQGV